MSKTVFAIAVLTLGILAVPGAARSETPLSTPEGAADQYVTGRMFYAPTEFSADGKQATAADVVGDGPLCWALPVGIVPYSVARDALKGDA